MAQQWEEIVRQVREAHHRKGAFIGRFENLVSGHGPSDEPSFLERAQSRWEKMGGD